jgi:hypothetical protein
LGTGAERLLQLAYKLKVCLQIPVSLFKSSNVTCKTRPHRNRFYLVCQKNRADEEIELELNHDVPSDGLGKQKAEKAWAAYDNSS